MNIKDHYVKVTDKLINLVTGMGTAKDKSTATQYTLALLNPQQLLDAYRGDWIARKVVNIPAQDATREGRTWNGEKEQITAIEAVEKSLNVMGNTKNAMIKSRLLGGGALLMKVEGTGEWSEELIFDRVGKDSLKYLLVVDKTEITSGPMERDIESKYYGQPQYYEFSTNDGELAQRIHPSRVIRFTGEPIPMRTVQQQDGWGDSVLQAVDTAIKNAGVAAEGIATLMQQASQDVFKIPEFMAQVGTAEYRDRIITRITLAQQTRSTHNAMLMDAAEEWETRQINFSTLPDLLQTYLNIAAGAADIPATRLLGQSPGGLNATGDSDIRNYYDNVGSYQRNELQPAIAPLDEVIIRSALGSRPPEIHYNWVSLWQNTEAEEVDLLLKRSQATANIANTGIVTPEVMTDSVVNMMIESGSYPGLETSVDELENDDVDETDPEALDQFNKLTGTLLESTVDETSKPQDMAMNGAQITSLQGIIESVANEEMPPETAKYLIMAGFPTIEPTDVDAMLAPLANFKPKEKEPALPGVITGVPQPGTEAPKPGLPKLRAVPNDMKDSEPKTLYVSRKVLNGAAILKWAKSQGIENLVPEDKLHVTITFSRVPVDWMKMGEAWMSELKIAAGGPRDMARNGEDQEAVVLLFACNDLEWRHRQMKDLGASWDWSEYQPHITISYDSKLDIKTIQPYTGAILLGPEIFEQVVEKWQETIK